MMSGKVCSFLRGRPLGRRNTRASTGPQRLSKRWNVTKIVKSLMECSDQGVTTIELPHQMQIVTPHICIVEIQ